MLINFLLLLLCNVGFLLFIIAKLAKTLINIINIIIILKFQLKLPRGSY